MIVRKILGATALAVALVAAPYAWNGSFAPSSVLAAGDGRGGDHGNGGGNANAGNSGKNSPGKSGERGADKSMNVSVNGKSNNAAAKDKSVGASLNGSARG